jgi:hypothetical protein
MAEQTFRSPGFFENETDLTGRVKTVQGVPAGIIGTAQQGPAFVPVTLGSFSDYIQKFGDLSSEQFGPHAVKAFLQHRTAVTYIRVLGAGGNTTVDDITTTNTKGTVKNAGFLVYGNQVTSGHSSFAGEHRKHNGTVQFLVAQHTGSTTEAGGYPAFSQNNSYPNVVTGMNLIRGIILPASGARVQLLDYVSGSSNLWSNNDHDNVTALPDSNGSLKGTFKLVISSALGSTFGNADGSPGLRVYTASLDPDSRYYYANQLNKNPDLFHSTQHLLYADFPVQKEIAKVLKSSDTFASIAILSGTTGKSLSSGDKAQEFRKTFGSFNTRYQTAKTTTFISQPFGNNEYNLFHFESLDDGEVGNTKVKVSITNLRKSTNVNNPYGTFTVLIRDFNDTDRNIKILEQYPLCNLNPSSGDYIANKIGDIKVRYNFDATQESERKLLISGKRPIKSRYVRIVMNAQVEDKKLPQEILPFGFKGIPSIKTNEGLTDSNEGITTGEGTYNTRIGGKLTANTKADLPSISNAIIPPLPLRFKCTRGASKGTGKTGNPGSLELSDARLYWGIKFENVPKSENISDASLNSNAGGKFNHLVESYTKFLGIQKLDGVVTGSGADAFNNNKFTLARVALTTESDSTNTLNAAITADITDTAKNHIKSAAYIRNGDYKQDTSKYTIEDAYDNNATRLTFASLISDPDSISKFNKFTEYLKFTNILHGGFDGLNIVDQDQRKMNDKASSTEAAGLAGGSDASKLNLSPSFSPGSGVDNNIINSYRTAARIITDPLSSRVNIVAIPGIKDNLVTDYTADLVRDYSKAIYLMDIASYDDSIGRLYDNSSTRPNVQNTIDQFESRAVNNSFVATYFPDIVKYENRLNENITLPSSIAAIKALAYNDAVSFPWFAPAGFNRGALEDVINTKLRLNTEERNILYEARINPIASFPQGGFVIFGQKTLQQDRSALDRVNVRRMLLEVKRIISELSNKFIFEQNTPALRSKFVSQVTPRLAIIQAQQGVDQFKIIMDSSNNTQDDIETNRLNGKIILVPTRAVEFISIDFIITNSGVSFE